MGSVVAFTYENFKEAVLRGQCEPARSFAPFINVDRVRFDRLGRDARKLDIKPLKDRLDSQWFAKVRGAAALTLRNARSFFPAYRFYVDEYLNDEWLATVDWHKEFHRDHVIHQPMSLYVGLSLLKGRDLSGNTDGTLLFGDNKSLLELCVDMVFGASKCSYLHEYAQEMKVPSIYLEDTPLARRMWEEIVTETFFLAALFHDIGYPWSFINRIHKALMPHSPVENPMGKGHEWLAEHYRNRLVFYPLNGYRKAEPSEPAHWRKEMLELVEEGLKDSHGMPGAMAMLHLNDIIRTQPLDPNDKPMRRFCIEWAAMAVMMHDLGGLYGKTENMRLSVKNPHLRVSFEQDPLSFILTLADKIQDFERPNAAFSSNDDMSKVRYFSRCQSVRLDWDRTTGHMKIIYGYKNPVDYNNNRLRFLPENELLYFHPKEGYLDYSGLGINRIELEAELL